MLHHPFFLLLLSTICQQKLIIKSSSSPGTRYSTTLIINESNSQLWSSVAINRSNWIPTANSENNEIANKEGPIRLTLDANPSTYWHSQWGSGHDDRKSSAHPFQFIVDLTQNTIFKAFSLEP